MIYVNFAKGALILKKSWFKIESNYHLGNIHVLRKQKGGREGVSQMLIIAYMGGGGAKGWCLRNNILEFFFALDRKITKKCQAII